ncbi:rab proteins geranylgeranyltransferase component A 2 [Aplysia californica]|uniref:Rab proteins geranylgeranyltransferase component A 2 n=1 Tax=Aplysia californica TaxID=6500 RepID=A0ABM0JFC1_APLCA|nr:rab proteins geranylgeranyltransferase component A 2 [Aplysia californica]
MASEDLPEEFDIIVLGTGLTETIASAAFSRIGLKVLHLDRNDYYGGAHGNFNLEGIENWKKKNEEVQEKATTMSELTEDVKKLVSEGESLVCLPTEHVQAYNIKSQFHVRERTAEEQAAAEEAKKSRFRPLYSPVEVPEPENKSEATEGASGDPTPALAGGDGDPEGQSSPEPGKQPGIQSDDDAQTFQPDTTQSLSDDKRQAEVGCQDSGDDELTQPVAARDIDKCQEGISQDSGVQTASESESTSADSSCVNAEDEKTPKEDGTPEETSTESAPDCGAGKKSAKEWTVGDISDDYRRYCFDLSPRVLHCCGDLVQLLIRSDVARYCEFRTVSRVLTLLKGQLQQVPCSRADVFSSSIVSLIEKRLLMKFLQFAAVYDTKPEEYSAFADKPFVEFLKSKKLSGNVQHFIQHAIAMVTDTVSTEEALKKTQKFLKSLGQYGNTAFLFPLYGSGELPQAFSRLSAVFGGIYCLMMTATHLVTDGEKKCTGIVTSSGQKVSCKYLVAEQTYLPPSFMATQSYRKLSRAIYITDRSIKEAEDQELSLLNFLCSGDASRPITVLELPQSAMVCPKNVYVVHLTRLSTGEDPEGDFSEVREKLFSGGSPEDTGDDRPRVLWSMHFQMKDRSEPVMATDAAQNVLVTSGGGDDSVDLDRCVQEAEVIFKTVCPDEEFLPTPPNPEDIIHVDDAEAAVSSGTSEYQEDGGDDGVSEKTSGEAPDGGVTEQGQAESGEVKDQAESGEVKDQAESGEVKDQAESGEMKGQAESGEVKDQTESGEVKGQEEAVEVKDQKESLPGQSEGKMETATTTGGGEE